MNRIVLASGSPRRRELLFRFGVPFDVIASTVEELPRVGEMPEDFARRAARDKCGEVAARLGTSLVIGADTVVALGDEILGKPRDAGEAHRTLRRLSGAWHRVITGLALRDGKSGREQVECAVTRVKFGVLDERIIDAYVATREPLDKAGSYGIQGLGGVLVERIDGCYYNVVGLPLHLLAEMLLRENVRLL